MVASSSGGLLIGFGRLVRNLGLLPQLRFLSLCPAGKASFGSEFGGLEFPAFVRKRGET
jgi:hypothetical protein